MVLRSYVAKWVPFILSFCSVREVVECGSPMPLFSRLPQLNLAKVHRTHAAPPGPRIPETFELTSLCWKSAHIP